MTTRVYWLSIHPPLPSQKAALAERFGGPVEIVHDRRPFDPVDEVVARYHAAECSDIVVVATTRVIGSLLAKGIRPGYADMKRVPLSEAEFRTKGSHPSGYKFVRFRRVKELKLEFEEF